MRAYFFCNMYLSSIQQGIQSAHCLAEMFVKYPRGCNDDEHDMLHDWAFGHKTIIILNAGYSSNIHSLVDFFNSFENPYPWSYFKESEDALDGAITCAGIILPEKIYLAASEIRAKDANSVIDFMNTGKLEFLLDGKILVKEYNRWEVELIKRINSFGLAK